LDEEILEPEERVVALLLDLLPPGPAKSSLKADDGDLVRVMLDDGGG